MKILQISHNYHVRGGSDAVFLATCDLLTAAGHQVVPFCIASPANLPSRWSSYFPHAADTRVAPIRDGLRYFYNSHARAQLTRLLDDAGPFDVAHLHIYHGKQTPAILPLLTARRIPVLHSLHEYKLACPTYTMLRDGQPCDLCVQGSDLNCIRYRCKDGSLLRSLVMGAEKLSSRVMGDVRRVDRFICVSAFQRRIMEKAGIPPAKLAMLHNFADAKQTATHGHDGYYLYFGRIEELKGIATLIAAAKSTGRRLLIAGTGPWTREMHLAISGYDNIKYLGFQDGDRLDRLIRQAVAVVVPSQWYENCPMSVLEAKAAGRPVIGADIGGIPELVRHGIDGFLFKPGNRDSLISAMDALEHANHARLCENARKDAKTRFSGKRHLQELLGHYSDVFTIRPKRQHQAALGDVSTHSPSQHTDAGLSK